MRIGVTNLSERQKELLLDFVCANGEIYAKYAEWAPRMGLRVFSHRYFRNWVQRHRAKIQTERILIAHRGRTMSVIDRKARLSHLESDLFELDTNISGAAPEILIKLIEQKRKVLQAIAIERGEWNAKEDPHEGLKELQKQIITNMARAAKALVTAEDEDNPPVEGVFLELGAGASTVTMEEAEEPEEGEPDG